jgi:hypothetical protein
MASGGWGGEELYLPAPCPIAASFPFVTFISLPPPPPYTNLSRNTDSARTTSPRTTSPLSSLRVLGSVGEPIHPEA